MKRKRSNPDEEYRRLAREPDADPVQQLIHKLRYGELTPQRILIAARLGHPVALEAIKLVDKVERKIPIVLGKRIEWRTLIREAVMAVHPANKISKKHRQLAVNFACDIAESILDYFEEMHPGETRPRDAVNLARSWARGDRITRVQIGNVVEAVLDLAADLAASYAESATVANTAAETLEAADPSTPNESIDYVTFVAVDAIAYGRTDIIKEAQREWQQIRLAQYVLGEV